MSSPEHVVMFACGYVAEAVDGRGVPRCYFGCKCKDARIAVPPLEGRVARCCDGNWLPGRSGRIDYGAVNPENGMVESPSDPRLPFFQYGFKSDVDEYYCGHGGWN